MRMSELISQIRANMRTWWISGTGQSSARRVHDRPPEVTDFVPVYKVTDLDADKVLKCLEVAWEALEYFEADGQDNQVAKDAQAEIAKLLSAVKEME